MECRGGEENGGGVSDKLVVETTTKCCIIHSVTPPTGKPPKPPPTPQTTSMALFLKPDTLRQTTPYVCVFVSACLRVHTLFKHQGAIADP